MTLPSQVPASDSSTVMHRLKEATAEAHRRAETRPLMQALARGTVSRALFASHLEQLLLVHRVLEAGVERAVFEHPHWGGITPAERCRAADLEADLRVLGGSLTPAPLPATAAAISAIERAAPLTLLGMFYVTEGSTNGGRFLAKKVAQTLGLDPVSRDGLRALDPYGERQPERWAAFKGAMNAIGFDAESILEIEAGAQAMFDHLGHIADAVESGTPG